MYGDSLSGAVVAIPHRHGCSSLRRVLLQKTPAHKKCSIVVIVCKPRYAFNIPICALCP